MDTSQDDNTVSTMTTEHRVQYRVHKILRSRIESKRQASWQIAISTQDTISIITGSPFTTTDSMNATDNQVIPNTPNTNYTTQYKYNFNTSTRKTSTHNQTSQNTPNTQIIKSPNAAGGNKSDHEL